MKTTRIIILFTVLVALLAVSVGAQEKERPTKKLPVGSYITSAKIEILSRDPERVKLALEYLSDLAYFYGPHSEAYFWSSQIYYDFIEQAPSPQEKVQPLSEFLAYCDSVHFSCESKDIKKKYQKGCDDFATKVDSTKVLLQRQYYNDGVEKMKELMSTKEDMDNDPDSASHGYYEEKINALLDTTQAYFGLSIMIDSTDGLAYIGIGNVMGQLGRLKEANEMLIKGLPSVDGEHRANMLLQVAYNYVNDGDYCESIDYFRKYLDEFGQEDTPNMVNLSSIYSRCDKLDSAFYWYQVAIGVDSSNIDALVGSGRYYNQHAIWALDSVRMYQDAKNQAKMAEWTKKREEAFGHSKEYFAQAYAVADTTNVDVAQDYGLVLFLLEDYKTAIGPFTRITQQRPNDEDAWATLGTCYLKLNDFNKCARAYEKVVQIDPNNRTAWESLEGLYKELKETENLKKAQEHLK